MDHISRSEAFQRRFEKYQGDAFLLMPIIGSEKVLGLLCVTDKIGMDFFSDEEQQALLSVSGQIISALENQRLAESLKRKRQTLRQKNLQLKKLERLKTDLFNMLIHDLKGPISELIANLDILSYRVFDEDQEHVEAAKAGCDTLYTMVCNLLDVTQLEEGRLDLVYERIDPRDLIKESLIRLLGLSNTKGVALVERFPSRKSIPLFRADRGILLRVLQNLLTNAINYSPSNEKIEVGFEYLKSSKIEIFVRDKGPGVPPEHRRRIFEKYFQLEKKRNGRTYNTGLGLAFCKMAIDAHRGKIGVSSEGMEGSRFFFTLPLETKISH